MLAAANDELVSRRAQVARLTQVFSPFTANTPQLFVDIDRVKATETRRPIATSTNHPDLFRLDLRQRLQPVRPHLSRHRRRPTCRSARKLTDLARLRTRNAAGDMVMLGSVVDFRDVSGPDRVARYNPLSGGGLQGETSPGTEFGDRDQTHEETSRGTLPSGFSLSGPTFRTSRSPAAMQGSTVFPICVLFVFLVLAGAICSWSLPFAVLLIVPMCLLAATIGVRIMGLDVNIPDPDRVCGAGGAGGQRTRFLIVGISRATSRTRVARGRSRDRRLVA
jgi:multidrug efflux pump subunit AcrB